MDINLGLGMVGIGICMGVGAIGSGVGEGFVAAAALKAYARQPELLGSIRTLMIVGMAITETAVIYALILSFMLYAKLPA